MNFSSKLMHKEYIEITQENKKVAKRWEKFILIFFTCTVSCIVPCNNILGSRTPVDMTLLACSFCLQWNFVNVTSSTCTYLPVGCESSADPFPFTGSNHITLHTRHLSVLLALLRLETITYLRPEGSDLLWWACKCGQCLFSPWKHIHAPATLSHISRQI